MRHTRRRRWVEAICVALGAGCASALLQPDGSDWHRQAIAFMAGALPVLVIHGRHGQTAPDPPRLIE